MHGAADSSQRVVPAEEIKDAINLPLACWLAWQQKGAVITAVYLGSPSAFAICCCATLAKKTSLPVVAGGTYLL